MILRWFHSSMSAFDEWCAAMDLDQAFVKRLDTPLSSRSTIMVLRLLEHPSPFFNPRKNAPRSQRSTHRKVLSAIRILDLHILYFKGQNLKYNDKDFFDVAFIFLFPDHCLLRMFPSLDTNRSTLSTDQGIFQPFSIFGGILWQKSVFLLPSASWSSSSSKGLLVNKILYFDPVFSSSK